MEKNVILEKINSVFELVLEHSNFQLFDETTAKDVDGWDSVTHLIIITEIENSFKIKFDLMELMNMNSVGDLIYHINTKI